MTDFAWNVPPEFNFARDVIDVLGHEDRVGLVTLDPQGVKREIHFPQIAAATRPLGGVPFRELGIAKGDRVIVLLPKIAQWLYAMIALDRLGAVVIPCSEQLRAKDLTFRANHGEASAIVAHASNSKEVDLLRATCPGLKTYLLVGADAPNWTSLDGSGREGRRVRGQPDARRTKWAYIGLHERHDERSQRRRADARVYVC